MIVLSIHDGHDSGVCLLRDGRELWCSSEERRTNQKNHPGIPVQSLQAVFKASGILPGEVDLVAVVGRIRNTVPTYGHKPIFSILNLLSSFARSEAATNLGQAILRRIRRRKELLATLAGMGLGGTPLRTYDHHACHAATAYYHRPWAGDATVLTLDGAGDGLCATVSHGSGLGLKVLARTPKFHSPAAWMYSAITAHLGLKPYEHEYKVMGMAPYGQPEPAASILRELFQVDGLRFRNRSGAMGGSMQSLLARRLSGLRFDNISAGCQMVFEELMLAWVKAAVRTTRAPQVCGAGGAFLNVKANKLIRELPDVSSLFVYPASDDGGTPVGAALLGYLDVAREKGVTPSFDLPKDMYLGLSFSEAEMEAAIQGSGLPYLRMTHPADDIAQELAAGRIIARFDGREEIGPRALGNRTIMADPRDLRVIRKLNFAIKLRDFWMPFAASILEEDVNRYVKAPSAWPYYMIEAFDTLPAAEHDLLAGMHPMDLTIRPQIVNDLNPGYRDIIRAFKARTGVGGLLNTSFNLHGSPIVGTPEVALRTLVHSGLDGLALGPFLVTKPAPGA